MIIKGMVDSAHAEQLETLPLHGRPIFDRFRHQFPGLFVYRLHTALLRGPEMGNLGQSKDTYCRFTMYLVLDASFSL
jgi:hypothetical protein